MMAWSLQFLRIDHSNRRSNLILNFYWCLQYILSLEESFFHYFSIVIESCVCDLVKLNCWTFQPSQTRNFSVIEKKKYEVHVKMKDLAYYSTHHCIQQLETIFWHLNWIKLNTGLVAPSLLWTFLGQSYFSWTRAAAYNGFFVIQSIIVWRAEWTLLNISIASSGGNGSVIINSAADEFRKYIIMLWYNRIIWDTTKWICIICDRIS